MSSLGWWLDLLAAYACFGALWGGAIWAIFHVGKRADRFLGHD